MAYIETKWVLIHRTLRLIQQMGSHNLAIGNDNFHVPSIITTASI